MPEVTLNISDKAQEMLEDFMTGMGYDDPSVVIQEALYAISESHEAYDNGDHRLVEGILAKFRRFTS